MRLSLLLLVLTFGVLAGSASAQTAVVTGQDAFLRGTPGETGAVVDTLAVSSRVHIIKRTGDWYLVQSFPFVGWIHGSLLRIEDNAATVTKPVKASLETNAPSKPVDQANGMNSDDTVPGPPQTAGERTYKRGPRGGCYYVKDGGKKVYVAHRLCDELERAVKTKP